MLETRKCCCIQYDDADGDPLFNYSYTFALATLFHPTFFALPCYGWIMTMLTRVLCKERTTLC